MGEARTTELLEKIVNGSKYIASHYDTDIDISGPKQISITTGASPAYMTITTRLSGAAVGVLNTGLVIGTGGSAAAGDAVTVKARELAATADNLTAIKSDYVLGSSGQSAGTAVETRYLLAGEANTFKYRLKASTAYGLVITSVADNNAGTITFEFDEA
jgi:hypothetical protein